MTYTEQTAAHLMSTSAVSGEIAHGAWNEDTALELLAECDDSADNDDVSEFWGETADGQPWRVHLHL